MKGQALSSVLRCVITRSKKMEQKCKSPSLLSAYPTQIFKMNIFCTLCAHNFYKLRYLISSRTDQIQQMGGEGNLCWRELVDWWQGKRQKIHKGQKFRVCVRWDRWPQEKLALPAQQPWEFMSIGRHHPTGDDWILKKRWNYFPMLFVSVYVYKVVWKYFHENYYFFFLRLLLKWWDPAF